MQALQGSPSRVSASAQIQLTLAVPLATPDRHLSDGDRLAGPGVTEQGLSRTPAQLLSECLRVPVPPGPQALSGRPLRLKS